MSSLSLEKKLFKNIQGVREYTEEASPLSCFILVACAPMLADKLGVPEARPRLEPDSRAVSSGVSASTSPLAEPETGRQHQSPAGEEKTSLEKAQSVSRSCLLNALSLYWSQRSSKPCLVSSAFC